jgi:hypothetical protein
MASRRVLCSATPRPTMEHSSREDDSHLPLGQWEIKQAAFVILHSDPATRGGAMQQLCHRNFANNHHRRAAFFFLWWVNCLEPAPAIYDSEDLTSELTVAIYALRVTVTPAAVIQAHFRFPDGWSEHEQMLAHGLAGIQAQDPQRLPWLPEPFAPREVLPALCAILATKPMDRSLALNFMRGHYFPPFPWSREVDWLLSGGLLWDRTLPEPMPKPIAPGHLVHMAAQLLSTGRELMAWSLEEASHVPLSVKTSLDVIASVIRVAQKMHITAHAPQDATRRTAQRDVSRMGAGSSNDALPAPLTPIHGPAPAWEAADFLHQLD